MKYRVYFLFVGDGPRIYNEADKCYVNEGSRADLALVTDDPAEIARLTWPQGAYSKKVVTKISALPA